MKTFLIILITTIGLQAYCESGHWIDEVSNDGSIVILEDSTVWKISSIDTITSMLWLPVTSITSCDYKLINIDNGEVVEARKLR